MLAGANRRISLRGRALLAALCCCLGLLLSAVPEPVELPVAPHPTHRLSPGDLLEIQLFDGLQRQSFTVPVDAAGEVTLPLVHDVSLRGLTTRAAADLLRERYRTYYVNPIVSVAIRALGELRIFVFGPDISGRMVSLPTGSSLLDLLATDDLNPDMLNAIRQERLGQTEGAVAEVNGQHNGNGQYKPQQHERVYTRGSYRRLHLLRAADGQEPLAISFSSAQQQVESTPTSGGARLPDLSAAGTVLAGGPPEGLTGSGLSSVMNWRRWIAERQQAGDCKLWVIDPLRMTLDGELSRWNLPLQDGDVLYLPVPERFVDISGVSKPGRYELLDEESLGDLLRIAGSVEYAWNLRNAVVQRYSADGRLNRIVTNIYPGFDDIAQIEAFRLENRDRISILPREERVFVLGEVNGAGAFEFHANSTVLDYLAQAGGETERAHLAWIAIIRQERDLLNPDAAPEVLRLNFKQLHAGYPSCAEVLPLPGDVIYVPPKGREFELPPILQAIGTVVSGYALIERAQRD